MEYRVRSTYTRKRSIMRRAADITVIVLISLLLVFVLFKFALVPVSVESSRVGEIGAGEIILCDRVSKFVVDYAPGDIVIAEAGGGRELLRVAAKGGSVYTVRGGRAYLDGALLDESAYSSGWPEECDFEIRVPVDKLLLLPDDRSGIEAPDDWLVSQSLVFGEVRFRVSPIKKLAFFV
jgi:hypothetical protein